MTSHNIFNAFTDSKQDEKAESIDSDSVASDAFPSTSEITMKELEVPDPSESDSAPNACGVRYSILSSKN